MAEVQPMSASLAGAIDFSNLYPRMCITVRPHCETHRFNGNERRAIASTKKFRLTSTWLLCRLPVELQIFAATFLSAADTARLSEVSHGFYLRFHTAPYGHSFCGDALISKLMCPSRDIHSANFRCVLCLNFQLFQHHLLHVLAHKCRRRELKLRRLTGHDVFGAADVARNRRQKKLEQLAVKQIYQRQVTG
jgi:hypothetical protein